jgi:hypothetical protein
MTGPFKSIQSLRPRVRFNSSTRELPNELAKDADCGSPVDSGSRQVKKGFEYVREWRCPDPIFFTTES